jgi:hypothetical protein
LPYDAIPEEEGKIVISETSATDVFSAQGSAPMDAITMVLSERAECTPAASERDDV